MRMLDESGSASCQFDSAPRQSDPLHAAEQLQQHFNSLARLHAGVQSEVSAERASKDPHPIASTQPRRLGQFNQPIPFSSLDFSDDAIGNMCRSGSVHDQSYDARAPSRSVPLQFDRNKGITREQRRVDFNLAPEASSPHPQARVVGHETGHA